MIQRQEEPVVGERIRAEEVLRIDGRIQGIQLPANSLFCFHPSERSAKVSIVESCTRGKKAIEGSRDVLEIGQALQSPVAVQTERILERHGVLIHEEVGELDAERIPLPALLRWTEKVVEIGSIIAGGDFPPPEMVVKRKMGAFILRQTRAGRIGDGEIEIMKQERIQEITTCSHGGIILVSLHYRICRYESDALQPVIGA